MSMQKGLGGEQRLLAPFFFLSFLRKWQADDHLDFGEAIENLIHLSNKVSFYSYIHALF